MPIRSCLALLVILAAAPASVVAQTLDLGGRRCATPAPTLDELVASVEVVDRYRASALRPALRAAAEPIVVPVAVHVITAGPTVEQGAIPEAWVTAQIDTLNAAFASMGLRFVLAAHQTVENAAWYSGLRLNSAEEQAMKQAHALDPARFLNVYTVSPAFDFLGWASVAQPGAEADRQQGVVLKDQTLPGGAEAPYNLGHTGTHEVGHWAGLAHTFQGGCSEPNDGVADTPQERSSASGCPTTRDSCPLDPGLDPVHNYMDYSDDACMTGFTAGQSERALALMQAYRPTVVAGGRPLATLSTTAFGRALVGVPTTAPIRVTNLTDAPLTVTGASSSDDRFALSPGLTVAPGDVGLLDVTFTADAVGTAAATLTLQTSAGEALTVAAEGTATLPPTARLAVAGVTGQTVAGEPVERTVEIANAGGGRLAVAVAETPPWVVSVDPAGAGLDAGEALDLTLTLDVGDDAPPSCAPVPVAAPGGDALDCSGVVVLATNDPLRPEVLIDVRLTVLPRPSALAIGDAYPNPGRDRVTLPLAVPDDAGPVTVEIVDVRGRRLATLLDGVVLGLGYRDVAWDATAAPAGVYLVRVRSDREQVVGRVTIAR